MAGTTTEIVRLNSGNNPINSCKRRVYGLKQKEETLSLLLRNFFGGTICTMAWTFLLPRVQIIWPMVERFPIVTRTLQACAMNCKRHWGNSPYLTSGGQAQILFLLNGLLRPQNL